MGLAFVKGLQGHDLRTGIAATCKHFAGYGGVNTNRQEFIAEILMPHEVAIKLGGAQSVMPGYHSYDGIPCIANHDLLTGILRGQLGFDGLIISDYGAMNSAGPIGTGAEKENTAAKCLNAGAEVELCQGLCFPFLPAAVRDGKVSQKTLDDAVRHSLMLKARLGLLDDEIQIGKDGPLDFDPPAHRRLAYQAACESLVLLKNNGILPLKNNVKKIALVGPNAGSFQALLGDYTYQSLSAFWYGIQTDPEKPKLVTLLEGLKSRVGGGITILHERGCDWSEPLESKLDTTAPGDPRLLMDSSGKMAGIKRLVHAGLPEANLSKALQFAAESDVVIAAMGENVYLCGEGRDRKGIRLPGEQEAFVQRLLDTGKPVILVLFGGRPQVIDTLEPRCAAVVQAWFPGEEGGNAVADLLLGNINPSGKLCVSYPKSDENRFMCYNEGYRADDLPMYPFGYGLSYTRYAYRDLRLPSVAQTSDEWLTVSFKVKNAGQKAGTEIVQLYVSPQGRSQPGKPIQLKAFRRVELGKGKERLVTFKISPQQLAYFSDGNWVIEPGKYEIMVAASSVDVRLKGTIELTGEKRTMKSRSIYFADQR
jgi:beta-glucosidase